MRLGYLLFVILLFLSCCSKNGTPKETSAVNQSCQRLTDLIQHNSTDTLHIKDVITPAYALAELQSEKHHDSLIAVVSYIIGRQFEKAKKFKDARIYYQNGLRLGLRQLPNDAFVIAQLYRYIGSTYYLEDDFKTALTYFDFVKIVSQDSASWVLKARTQRNIAECYQRLKNLKAAEYIYNDLIYQFQKYFSYKEKIEYYHRYSFFLREIKAFSRAINMAQQSADILEPLIKEKKAVQSDSIFLANTYYYIAYALQDSMAYKASEPYYLKSLAIYKAVKDMENYRRGLMNIGLMYRYDKRFDKAEQVLTEGIVSLNKEEQTDFNIVRKGKLFNNRSEVYLDIKDYKKALRDQDSAIYYLTLYDRRASLTTLLFSNRKSLLSTYENKAKIYAIYAENGQDTEGYQKAIKMTQELIKITDDIRADYFSDDAKLTLANDIKPALEKAIDVCYKLYLKTKDKQYLDQAFGFVEYSRSMVLYENARLENQLPTDLKAENEALKKLERDLIQDNNVEKLQNYLRLKRQFREKIKALNRNQLAPVSDLQAALIKDDKTAFIEYFVGDSAVFVFSLSKKDKQLIKLNKPKDLDKQIENIRDEITQPNPVSNSTAFEQQSKAIYALLLNQTLTPLPKTINQLIIAPDGVLNYLPFDILIKDSSNFNNSKELINNKSSHSKALLAANKSSKDSPFIIHPSSLKEKDSSLTLHNSSLKDTSFLRLKQKSMFLLYQYTISYAYSANLLWEQKKPKPKEDQASKLFAGFASKYEEADSVRRAEHSRGTRGSAYDLPFAKKEVQDISSMMGIFGGTTFTGKDATEAVFKAEASNYRILHFAMHALADDKDPAFSKLLFTLTPKDATDDNNLTAAELYTMNLKADLAVLSACNTGFGTINKGEGVMNLARAFASAHVPATVTSLWKVDDQATREIMVNFYTNLKQGMSKDAALSEAKKTYLDNAPEFNAANPYFWAGFVPTGNMDAMDLDVKYPLSMWGILGTLIAASGLGFWYWKRR